MNTPAPCRIPVCNPAGVIIERIDSSRARRLAAAPNAIAVRKRKGEIVRILLQSHGDDSLEYSTRGNPRSYSHNHATETNPENCWTLKYIPSQAADLFDTVITELAA
jgi:hypothetical protein